jgi:hypothetical protein
MRAMDVKGQSKTLHFVAKRSVGEREKRQLGGNDTFNDKQSQIAERKTGDPQRPGERGKNAA